MNTTKHPGGRGLVPRAAALIALLLPLLAPAAAAAPNVPPKHISGAGGMSFGRFVPAGGGFITVSPAGIRTRTGAVVLLMSTASAARFNIGISSGGNEHRAYILTLPANGAVALSSGPNRMPLMNFVASDPGGGALPPGTRSVSIGATLQVAPNQPRGNYSGVIPVILEYQ